MSASRALLTGCLFAVCGLVLAADEEIPEAEFLEYLGMWEESDEEWLLLDEPVAQASDERIDPVPEGEESTEKEDDEG
jgi:hypothetical protein